MPFILGKTVTEIFQKRATQTPGLIGFKYKSGRTWREVSFAEFFSEVRSVSFGLMSLGVQKGERVCLMSPSRFEWSVCDLAILASGAITVPIYPSNTAQDAGYILNHSEAKILLLDDQQQLQKITSLRAENPDALPFLEKIVIFDVKAGAPVPESLITLHALREAGQAEQRRHPSRFEQNLKEAKPSDIISIVYTSGTTGVPKGALITHDSIVSVLEDCVTALSDFTDSEKESTLSFLPFSHIFGKVESLAVHTFGWNQAFAESMDKLLPNMAEIRPTLLFSVPRTFEKAYSSIQAQIAASGYVKKRLFRWAVASEEAYFSIIGKRQLPPAREITEYLLARKLVFSKITQAFGGRLRYVICGGAPLSRELGAFFQIAGIKILEGYGLTETCGPVSVNTPEDIRYGTVGRPLAEVSVRIAEDGEIEVRSRKIFAGYYKAPEETAAVLKDGWFKTGDIGFIDDDGFIHITDRKKDIIVTAGGKNIPPQKIESLAKAFSWIGQIVVIGDRKPYLIALLTLNREEVIHTASEKGILFSEYAELIKNSKIISITHQVIDKINAQLAKYETIKKFMILPNEFTVASGELTPSLKVKRKLIQSRYQSEIKSLYESSPAHDEPHP